MLAGLIPFSIRKPSNQSFLAMKFSRQSGISWKELIDGADWNGLAKRVAGLVYLIWLQSVIDWLDCWRQQSIHQWKNECRIKLNSSQATLLPMNFYQNGWLIAVCLFNFIQSLVSLPQEKPMNEIQTAISHFI